MQFSTVQLTVLAILGSATSVSAICPGFNYGVGHVRNLGNGFPDSLEHPAVAPEIEGSELAFSSEDFSEEKFLDEGFDEELPGDLPEDVAATN